MSWRRFCEDRGGNIAVLFAMAFAVSAVLGAVAVDAAALYHERRMIQNGVDLAALSAATDTVHAATIAQQSMVDAGLLVTGSSTGLTVVTGNYNPDPAISANLRFVAGKAPPNAVRVSFQRPGQLHFARGWARSPTIAASAIATVTPQVSFSIGSRLARLQGGIANGVLNALLGSSVSLTLADYNGLANVQVDLFRFLDSLALQLGITAGTYDDLLKAKVNHGVLLKAVTNILSGTDRVAASKLAQALGHNGVVPLGKLFQLGKLGNLAIGSAGTDGLFTTVSVLEMIAASAGLSDGSHQVALALTAGIPGLAALNVSLAVGEPPQGGSWYAVGAIGSVVRTAQVRLKINASVLGAGVLLGQLIDLPLYVEAAHSEAIVQSAICPTPTAPRGSATILTRPGLLRVILGNVNAASFGNFNTTPTIAKAKLVEVAALGIPILRVFATAMVEIAQTTPIPLSFSSSEIDARTVKTAKTTTVVTSLVGSLLDHLTLEVPILGLGLNLSSLGILLKSILYPIAPLLDVTIARLLEVVGVSVGEADVRVYGVHCSHPVLVG